jgi:hypothetical protein
LKVTLYFFTDLPFSAVTVAVAVLSVGFPLIFVAALLFTFAFVSVGVAVDIILGPVLPFGNITV